MAAVCLVKFVTNEFGIGIRLCLINKSFNAYLRDSFLEEGKCGRFLNRFFLLKQLKEI